MSIGKGKTKILLLLAFAAALCLALGACGGGGGGAAANNSSPFSGKWMAYEMSDSGGSINYDTADADEKAMLDSNYIVFSDNGTLEICDEGHSVDATWEATGDTIGTIEANNMTFTMSYDGEFLTITNPSGASMVMQRR